MRALEFISLENLSQFSDSLTALPILSIAASVIDAIVSDLRSAIWASWASTFDMAINRGLLFTLGSKRLQALDL